MKPVRVTPPAKAELREAALWYRDKSRAVAIDFVRQVRLTLGLLENYPGAGSSVPFLDDAAIRRFPVRRFPFQVVYVELDDVVEVVAIVGDHRRPGYWIGR